MNKVILGGKTVRFRPSDSIGKGGEADVYKIGSGLALKIYKGPDHPDLLLDPEAQRMARARLALHQTKLTNFPKNLPPVVIVPIDLAHDPGTGQIVGYSMRFLDGATILLEWTQPGFRGMGISNNRVNTILVRLHQTFQGIHQASVVVGDVNDSNILVDQDIPYFIDADSFRFVLGDPLVTFSEKFVDPLLCDPRAKELKLILPQNEFSDWYAFAVVFTKLMFFVDPYGGVYQPKNAKRCISIAERPLHRITLFHPEVRYPKKARPLNILPDDVLEYLRRVFEKDLREVFPIRLIDSLVWTKCRNCASVHARRSCPECKMQVVKPVQVIARGLTVRQVFKTFGSIRFATIQDGTLYWLYHENGELKRENGQTVTPLVLNPTMRFRVSGNKALIAQGNRLVTVQSGQQPKLTNIDTFGNLPMFDANSDHTYWLENGNLVRDDGLGIKRIGNVLQNQTLFWVGPRFGFGYYRAASFNVAFVFDAKREGINDTVSLPQTTGQILDSSCVFSSSRCWFFLTSQAGKTVNSVYVILADGTLEAQAQAEDGDGTWLGSIRGKCATGNVLLAPTDEGVVRVEVENGTISQTLIYKETEPHVSEYSNLFLSPTGSLFVVTASEIKELTLQ